MSHRGGRPTKKPKRKFKSTSNRSKPDSADTYRAFTKSKSKSQLNHSPFKATNMNIDIEEKENDNDYIESEDGLETPTQSISFDHSQYKKLYNALKDLERYVELSIPEFIFIGLQSSGKTSAVSQAAKMPVGIMRHGTASRCPTQFKLISNLELNEPKITVRFIGNKDVKPVFVKCKDAEELTDVTSQIHSQFADKGKFGTESIEVRIESSDVPELTFIDLPGLIKNGDKYPNEKVQLDELTATYMKARNSDGSYKYMPILVREPVDKEHDTDYEIKYIDALLKKYGSTRINWKKETLHVVNKFDRQIQRENANELINYMDYCCKHGKTVITMMNVNGAHNTSNMNPQELAEYVANAEREEVNRWIEIEQEFKKRNDPNYFKLIQKRKQIAGIGNMNKIISDKMCEIVKDVLPSIERRLHDAEKQKFAELAELTKRIEMCDPGKLQNECIQFNNAFLNNLKALADGTINRKLDEEYKKTWQQEVLDFHANATIKLEEWEGEIEHDEFINLLKTQLPKTFYGPHKNYSRSGSLLSLLLMRTLGMSALMRINEAWIGMVAFMKFPKYSDEDIVLIANGADACIQPDLWKAIRNVVLDSVSCLELAAGYLAEMYRYKLKENGKIIFNYTLEEKYGKNNNNKIIKLLRRTLSDYEKAIDRIIDDFISVAKVVPTDLARILDKTYCDECINIGKLIDRLTNYGRQKIGCNHPKDKQQSDKSNILTTTSTVLKKSGLPFGDLASSIINVFNDDKEKIDDAYELHSDEEKEKEKENINVIYDVDFYSNVYGLPPKVLYNDSAYYNIQLIRHQAKVFWIGIKRATIRDVIQKLENRVMAHINGIQSAKMSDAVQCGVELRELKDLIYQLATKTGRDVKKLEKQLLTKTPIKIPKAINELTPNEISAIYGIDTISLKEEKKQKLKQLKKFKKEKAQTLFKIQNIKKNKINNLIENIELDSINLDIDFDEEDDDESFNNEDNNSNLDQNEYDGNEEYTDQSEEDEDEEDNDEEENGEQNEQNQLNQQNGFKNHENQNNQNELSDKL